MLRLFFAVVCAGFKPALAIPPPVDLDAPKYAVVERLACLHPLNLGLVWDRAVPLWGGKVFEDKFDAIFNLFISLYFITRLSSKLVFELSI